MWLHLKLLIVAVGMINRTNGKGRLNDNCVFLSSVSIAVTGKAVYAIYVAQVRLWMWTNKYVYSGFSEYDQIIFCNMGVGHYIWIKILKIKKYLINVHARNTLLRVCPGSFVEYTICFSAGQFVKGSDWLQNGSFLKILSRARYWRPSYSCGNSFSACCCCISEWGVR